MQALATATLAQPSPLRIVWQTQRPKIFAGVLLALALVTLFLVFDTDTFFVYDLQISGTHILSDDEIQKASGILQYNIFFVNSRDVENALTKLAEVKSARVTIRMPNQVMVDIEERKPELTWLRGNESFWIDSDGISFRARKNLAELPVVRDLDQTPVKLGQDVKSNALAAFWAFRAAYPDGPRSFEWSAARGLAFTDERGWKIYMGDADEMAGKIAKLRALTTQLITQNTKIKFIDLGKGDPYYQ